MLFKEQFGVKFSDGFLKHKSGNKNIMNVYYYLNDMCLVIELVKMRYQKYSL